MKSGDDYITTENVPTTAELQRVNADSQSDATTNAVDRSLLTRRPAGAVPGKTDAAADRPSSGRRRPTRTIVNFWLDTALLVVLLAHATAVAIVYLVFPVGTAAEGWKLWSLTYDQWCGLQFALLCVLGFGVLIHVMLHWTWVCSVLIRNVLQRQELPDNGIRTLYGVGLLIVLLHIVGGIVLLAEFTIQRPL